MFLKTGLFVWQVTKSENISLLSVTIFFFFFFDPATWFLYYKHLQKYATQGPSI